MQKSLFSAPQKFVGLKDDGAASAPPSIISSDVQLIGDLHSSGDFQIDGTVKGKISCARLVISENGTVMGDIIADQVVIRGKLQGHLQASHVTLSDGSEIEADVEQTSLVIE